MERDKYGQIILDEMDICHLYLKDPNINVYGCVSNADIGWHSDLEILNKPELIQYIESHKSIEEWDNNNQAHWHMPAEYKNLDIAAWLLDQCKTDEQKQRVGHELLLYLDRNLFPLLQYLKYLVDTMRKYNVVWGVGRGSSVSSYVLYLMGVHKVDSMYYDLDIVEFLR